MRRLRRVTALFVSFLLVHIMWAGSGFACAMPNAVQSAGGVTDGVEMLGMEMPHGVLLAETVPSGGGSEHHHAPCDLPWVPDGCQSMTPCAPLALTAHADTFAQPAGVPASIAPLVVLAPPSLALTPESPPPRA